MSTVVISFWYENFREAVQIAIIGLPRINKFLGSSDAMFFQHCDQHLGIYDRTGIKQFHRPTKAWMAGRCTRIRPPTDRLGTVVLPFMSRREFL